MRTISLHSRRPAALTASAVACAIGLSACGGFDSAGSGEALIRSFVKKFGQGKVSVKSAHCPGGVKQQVGGTYSCTLVLHDKVANKDHPGTVTIHMTSGNKVRMTGQDLRVT